MAVSETARLIASLELKDLFTKQVDNAEKSLGRFDKRLDSTQSRAYRAGAQIGTGIKRGLAIAVTAIGTAAVVGGTVFAKAIKSASDLSETVSKVGVVFGKASAGVLAFGKTSAAALGLSQQAADEAAATYGNLFVAMGFTQKRSAEMSVALVKLASDLASFNNIDPAEALDKLRSGLTGEFEPLKTLGVNINDTILKAEALKLGLVKLEKGQKTYTAVLTPAQKAQAAYALIFEQTKTAQGDFARTQGGVANQTRILKANWDDLKATLATPILPKVALVFQRINAALKENQPAIANLGNQIADFVTPERINTAFDSIGKFLDIAKTAAPILERSAEATLSIVQAAVGVFNTLPDPIKGLLVGGVALNKLTGGLVTNIGGAIVDLVAKSRGATPANPVFVADVTGGLGGAAGTGGGLLKALGSIATKLGGLALIGGGAAAIGAGTSLGGPAGAGVAAGGAAAAIGGGALIAGPLGAIAASLGAVVLTLKDVRDQSAQQGQGIADSIKNELAGGATVADLRKSLDAVDQGINDIQANPLNVLVAGDALDQLRAQHDLLVKQIAAQDATAANVANANAILDRGGKDTIAAISDLAGKERDDANFIADTMRAIGARQAKAIETLQHSSNPKAILAALKDIEEITIRAGHGNLATAQKEAAAIRKQLQHVHDPALRTALTKALHDVEGKIPGREYAQRQIAKADSILRSSKSVDDKIRGLQAIENDLKNHKLPGQTRALQAKIDALKASQAAKQQATTQAIKDKDLSLSLHVTVPVTSTAVINSRVIASSNATFNNYFTRGRATSI